MILIFLIIIIIIVVFLIIFKKVNSNTVLEGVIIGIISGFIISLITDGNFRANMFNSVTSLLHIKTRYISQNWRDIQSEKVGSGAYNVKAFNVNTGAKIEVTNVPLSELPADLRYDITTKEPLPANPMNIIPKKETNWRKIE
jgi:hypothetical protein